MNTAYTEKEEIAFLKTLSVSKASSLNISHTHTHTQTCSPAFSDLGGGGKKKGPTQTCTQGRLRGITVC